MLVISASAPSCNACSGKSSLNPKCPPQAASIITGTDFLWAAPIRGPRSEIVPKYPGSVSKIAMGFCASARSTSDSGIPIGNPVDWSMSGDIQIGSRSAKTRALKIDLCAVLDNATLSPGSPNARTIAWLACVEPPVENRAKSAPHRSAANCSALFNVP